MPQCGGQHNEFGIHLCARKAQGLRADLVELAITATLWALMTEHGSHVVQALATFVKHVVLDHSAHHTGSRFGAKGELLAVQAVFKGVHLLFHNVGHLAQTTHKQGSGFNDGRAQVAIGMARHQAAHFFFQPLPLG